MKRVISILLTIMLLCTSIVPVFAINDNYEEVGFSSDEVFTIAVVFAFEGITNGDFSSDIVITNYDIIYDLDESIVAYSFNFGSNGVESGYVIVSVLDLLNPIVEFSYEATPIYTNYKKANHKIYKGIGLDYYIGETVENIFSISENEIVKKSDEKAKIKNHLSKLDKSTFMESKKMMKENNKLIKNMLHENSNLNLEYYLGGPYNGMYGDDYAISYLYSYLLDKYNFYDYNRGKLIYPFTGYLQSSFGSSRDCVIMSISTIAKYYSEIYTNAIPNNINDIYNDVLAVAETYGYNPSSGTLPVYVDNIARDVFSQYWGETVASGNHLYGTFSQLENEADSNRPFMLSTPFGDYGNHTLSGFGYKIYNSSTGSEIKFIAVRDNYSVATRYIDWDVYTSVAGPYYYTNIYY